MSRLCILVPYRDRLDHLARFVPHVTKYLEQDEHLQGVSPQIVIVEQHDNKPFNKGALLNAGFLVAENALDYVCFHDVDFLPIDADYSIPEYPTRRIWRGAESRPCEPGGVHLINHRFDWLFGGVSIFRKAHFRRVNGFSNLYQGWGYEDGDLRERCRAEGLGPEFGHGQFEPLDHVNRGINRDLSFTDEALANRERYKQRWIINGAGPDHRTDGLNTAGFNWTETRSLIDDLFGVGSYSNVRHLLIELYEPISATF